MEKKFHVEALLDLLERKPQSVTCFDDQQIFGFRQKSALINRFHFVKGNTTRRKDALNLREHVSPVIPAITLVINFKMVTSEKGDLVLVAGDKRTGRNRGPIDICPRHKTFDDTDLKNYQPCAMTMDSSLVSKV